VDVIQSVQEFFTTGALPPNINSNMLVLIPKITGALAMGDFRPIALANFQFKIVTKILADRLSIITMRIISPEQQGFIRDRNISECIIIASEAINMIDKRQFGGNVALKIDIKKAFDTLDWNFLVAVLRKFGFSSVFTDWILAIFHSAKLSILVNGKAVGFISCSRGVRQGDPLSPLLFCIAEEVLNRAISMASSAGMIVPMFYCRGASIPTHILYADDVLIFCASTKQNIRCLLKIFNEYSNVSEQIINNSKSQFYAGAMTSSRSQMLVGMLGFSAGNIPFSCLGCPIFKGKPKGIFFQSIVDKIKVKFATWKGTLLSIMGRVQLVKSVIHGMLVYSFHIYMWTSNNWIKIFIWSGDIYTRKICTVSWKVTCRSWAAGGLDLKPTRIINESLILHLAWKFSTGDSQWARLLRQRFVKHATPLQCYFQSSVWGGIKEHLDTISAN